jgi:hypothetical protein
MKTAKILFRVASALVLLASLLAASGASASDKSVASASGKIPVSLTTCPQEIRDISLDPLVLWFRAAWIPDVGPNGKEGLEGTITGPTYIKIKPDGIDANIRGLYNFDGRVLEAGHPVWSGHLRLLMVASGPPTDVLGTWISLDSRVHFVGRSTTPGAPEKCASMGYDLGGHFITGEVHITPAR